MAENETKGRRARTSETARGGQAVKAKYGPEFFREIGRLGGEATKARHGAAHYAEIGRKGGQHGKGQPKPGAGRTRRTAG